MSLMRNTLTTLGTTFALLAAAPLIPASAQTGIASWYKMGHTTANGESYNPDGLTAAHPSLPFGTMVKVENLSNGRSVRLRINDRGPFTGGRIIDVSRGGARQLGLVSTGTARVRVTALGSASGTFNAADTASSESFDMCEAFGYCH